MRNFVAPIVCVALLIGGVSVVSGCKASASIGSEPPKAAPPPPPPPPAPVAKKEEAPKRPRMKMAFKMKGDTLELPGPVVFETGSAKLKPESDEVLNIVNEYMKETKNISLLRIEGHTDSDGDDKANQSLSEGRAMSVAQWLVAKGTDCKRLLPVGFGETKPVADNSTAEGKAQNRRTAFVNAARDGKPIGNFPVDGGGKNAGDPCK